MEENQIKKINKICSKLKYIDKNVQVDVRYNRGTPQTTFICNRYQYSGTHCDSEVLTKIIHQMLQALINQVNKNNLENDICLNKINLNGILEIRCDEQCLDLAGVTLSEFELLFQQLHSSESEQNYFVEKNKFLIFLIKMKTGLTFSAISALLSINEVLVTEIFLSTLLRLFSATSNLIFWPTDYIVYCTTPFFLSSSLFKY